MGNGSGIQSLTISQCNSVAKTAGSPYFGMQYFQNVNSDTTPSRGQCFYGTSTNSNYAKYSAAPIKSVQDARNMGNSCTTGTNNMIYGAAGANAVYKVY
jgi:hypothetical protein